MNFAVCSAYAYDGSWEVKNGSSAEPTTDFTLGTLKIGGVANTDDLWIDNFAIEAGYQTAY